MIKDFKLTIDTDIYKLKGTDGKLYILSAFLDGIQGAMDFMRQVIYKNQLFATAYKTASGDDRTTISSIGKHWKFLPSYIQLFSNDYKFSPLIEFFFEEYRKHPIQDYLMPMYGDNQISVAIFNDFLTSMRKNAITINLRKRVADWESKAKKNEKRLIKFEAALFKRYSRLMVVRLDFNYHKATFTPEEIKQIIDQAALQKDSDQTNFLDGKAVSTPRAIDGRIALEEVQKDRKRLFTNMKGKPSLFKHLVGYVWRIECGRTAGYHLHVMLFFDGAYTQKHEYLAQKIGCYWQDDITQGRSYFENCNRKKEKYGDSWALGEINHSDADKRAKLSYAMQYFCKTNQLVQVIPYVGCHLFGCGFVHRQRKVYGGRPRTKGVDVTGQEPL
jgi:hypothetical protein